MAMNLGTQLQQAVQWNNEAARRAEQAKRTAEAEVKFKNKMVVEFFFDYAFRLFEFRLLNGVLPGVVDLGKTMPFREAASVLESYKWEIGQSSDWRSNGVGVWAPGHPFHNEWRAFERRCSAAGVSPEWTYCSDGMGQNSWYELTVTVPA